MMSTLTHTVQVTMDDWNRMHCGVLFLKALVMIAATHSSTTRWKYPAAIAWLEEVDVGDVQWTHKPEAVSQT